MVPDYGRGGCLEIYTEGTGVLFGGAVELNHDGWLDGWGRWGFRPTDDGFSEVIGTFRFSTHDGLEIPACCKASHYGN